MIVILFPVVKAHYYMLKVKLSVNHISKGFLFQEYFRTVGKMSIRANICEWLQISPYLNTSGALQQVIKLQTTEKRTKQCRMITFYNC